MLCVNKFKVMSLTNIRGHKFGYNQLVEHPI